jgi:hypothetical protein
MVLRIKQLAPPLIEQSTAARLCVQRTSSTDAQPNDAPEPPGTRYPRRIIPYETLMKRLRSA